MIVGDDDDVATVATKDAVDFAETSEDVKDFAVTAKVF